MGRAIDYAGKTRVNLNSFGRTGPCGHIIDRLWESGWIYRGKNVGEKKKGVDQWTLRRTNIWGIAEERKFTRDAGKVREGRKVPDFSSFSEGSDCRCSSPQSWESTDSTRTKKWPLKGATRKSLVIY